MKQKVNSDADKQIIHRIKVVEGKVVTEIKAVFSEREEKDTEFVLLSEALTSYYNGIISIRHMQELRVNSLWRMLEFTITFPVRNNLNKYRVAEVYDRVNIINDITYLLFQISDATFTEKLMGEFISYIRGSYIERLTKLFFYRINPDFILHYCIKDGMNDESAECEMLCSDEMNSLSEKELYYCIATGFVCSDTEKMTVISQLYNRSFYSKEAFSYLKRLYDEGFDVGKKYTLSDFNFID